MTAACCLPTPLPTRRPLHQRAADGLHPLWRALGELWRALLEQQLERRRRAALRGLSAHTLRDIGLGEYASQDPVRPDPEWDARRWQ